MKSIQSATIETTDNEIFHLASEFLSELGFVVEVDDLMLKSQPNRLRKIIVTTTMVGGAISAWLPVAQWLYEQCREKADQKTVVNGNVINANTVTIQTLNQYLCNQKGSSTDKQNE